MTAAPIYGLMAEFETPTELVEAAKGAYAAGYRKMDTYTPYPLEEAAEAIGAHHNRVSLVVLIGAMLGMIGGYSLEYWVSAVAYPINAGGKPFHSWPAFIPVTFECASKDRFFLCIESQDPRFSLSDTRKLLEGFRPEEITEVPY